MLIFLCIASLNYNQKRFIRSLQISFRAMTRLIQNIYFLELKPNSDTAILDKYFRNRDLTCDFEVFKVAANPLIDDEGTHTGFFTMTVGEYFYYIFVFHTGEGYFAVAVDSTYPFVHLFESFFDEVDEHFEKDPDLKKDAKEAYQYILKFLVDFDVDYRSKIDVNFPSGEVEVDLDMQYMTFMQFSPFRFFTKDELGKLFKAYLRDESVVFYCRDPFLGYRAVCSSFAIVSPLQYDGPFLLGLKKDDPRVPDLLNGTLRPKVILTYDYDLYSDIDAHKRFRVKKLKVSKSKKSEGHRFMKKCRDKVRVLLDLFTYLMDELLDNNPWSDSLNLPLEREDFIKICRKYDPNFDSKYLGAFHTSQTYRLHRKRMLFRSNFQESVKSFQPSEICDSLTDDQLRIIAKTVEVYPEHIVRDVHLVAILDNYKGCIRRRGIQVN